MTAPGSAHPSGGVTIRPPSSARLVLAAGLLGLGLGDLTLINMVLLPRYLADAPGKKRATVRPTARPPAVLAVAAPAAHVTPPSVPPSPPALPPVDKGTAVSPAVAPTPPPSEPVSPPVTAAAEPPGPPPSAPPTPLPDAAFPDLLFALNATWLSPPSRATLDQVTLALQQAPERRVVLRGHADHAGPEEFNRSLSLARARQARRYLHARGIESARIAIESFGSRRPADQQTTPAARARNRRVEIALH